MISAVTPASLGGDGFLAAQGADGCFAGKFQPFSFSGAAPSPLLQALPRLSHRAQLANRSFRCPELKHVRQAFMSHPEGGLCCHSLISDNALCTTYQSKPMCLLIIQTELAATNFRGVARESYSKRDKQHKTLETELPPIPPTKQVMLTATFGFFANRTRR